MNPQEYARMHALETDYWWFAGRRAIISSLLRVAADTRENTPRRKSANAPQSATPQSATPGEDRSRHMSTHVAAQGRDRRQKHRQTHRETHQPPQLLDIGCGTGANLPLLLEFVGPGGCVTGLDFSLLALRFAHDYLAQDTAATSVFADDSRDSLQTAFEVGEAASNALANGDDSVEADLDATSALDDASSRPARRGASANNASANNASANDISTNGAATNGAARESTVTGRVALLRGDALRLPFPDGCFDIVTMLDVLEHLSDDRRALLEVSRVLRPGGALVWSVPAYQKLWSAHDEALHHFRRYESRALGRLMRQSGFEVQLLSFAMSLMPPLAWLWRRLVLPFQPRRPRDAKRHSQGAVLPSVPPVLNRALVAYLALEGRVIAHRPLRFGTSLVGIARKKNN